MSGQDNEKDTMAPALDALKLLFPGAEIEQYIPQPVVVYSAHNVEDPPEVPGHEAWAGLQPFEYLPEEQVGKEGLWAQLLIQLRDVPTPVVPDDYGKALVFYPHEVDTQGKAVYNFQWVEFLAGDDIRNLMAEEGAEIIQVDTTKTDYPVYSLGWTLWGMGQQLSMHDSEINTINQALPLKADLVDDLVPASQLPSYVDDVLEFDSIDDFPEPGEAGKIYVDKATNLTYRWGGTIYVQIGGGDISGKLDIAREDSGNVWSFDWLDTDAAEYGGLALTLSQPAGTTEGSVNLTPSKIGVYEGNNEATLSPTFVSGYREAGSTSGRYAVLDFGQVSERKNTSIALPSYQLEHVVEDSTSRRAVPISYMIANYSLPVISANEDIPHKKYVDDAIAASSGAKPLTVITNNSSSSSVTLNATSANAYSQVVNPAVTAVRIADAVAANSPIGTFFIIANKTTAGKAINVTTAGVTHSLPKNKKARIASFGTILAVKIDTTVWSLSGDLEDMDTGNVLSSSTTLNLAASGRVTVVQPDGVAFTVAAEASDSQSGVFFRLIFLDVTTPPTFSFQGAQSLIPESLTPADIEVGVQYTLLRLNSNDSSWLLYKG